MISWFSFIIPIFLYSVLIKYLVYLLISGTLQITFYDRTFTRAFLCLHLCVFIRKMIGSHMVGEFYLGFNC